MLKIRCPLPQFFQTFSLSALVIINSWLGSSREDPSKECMGFISIHNFLVLWSWEGSLISCTSIFSTVTAVYINKVLKRVVCLAYNSCYKWLLLLLRLYWFYKTLLQWPQANSAEIIYLFIWKAEREREIYLLAPNAPSSMGQARPNLCGCFMAVAGTQVLRAITCYVPVYALAWN